MLLSQPYGTIHSGHIPPYVIITNMNDTLAGNVLLLHFTLYDMYLRTEYYYWKEYSVNY